MNIENKKIFVFDWDGTLFDSMKIKRDNFVSSFIHAYSDIDVDKKSVREMYINLSGKPRQELFLELSEKLTLKPAADTYSKFDDFFNLLNLSRLINAKLFPDAEKFILSAYKKGRKIFISSSVPEDELLIITQTILNNIYLDKIEMTMGTTNDHQKGISHIRDICEIAGCDKKDIQFFGDDFEDYKLSEEAGVECIVVDRENKLLNYKLPTINSFNDIQEVMHGKV